MFTIGSTTLAIRGMHTVLAFLCMALTVAAQIAKVVRETIIIPVGITNAVSAVTISTASGTRHQVAADGVAICLPSR